jgi:hypothetical protein
MYLQKVMSKNIFKKELLFVDIMSATDKKSRIRIRKSAVRIPGSGSMPKCHGSTPLVMANAYSRKVLLNRKEN